MYGTLSGTGAVQLPTLLETLQEVRGRDHHRAWQSPVRRPMQHPAGQKLNHVAGDSREVPLPPQKPVLRFPLVSACSCVLQAAIGQLSCCIRVVSYHTAMETAYPNRSLLCDTVKKPLTSVVRRSTRLMMRGPSSLDSAWGRSAPICCRAQANPPAT